MRFGCKILQSLAGADFGRISGVNFIAFAMLPLIFIFPYFYMLSIDIYILQS
jgi:hypothetical protein